MLRFLLLYRIDWTDEHPGVVFSAMGAILLLGRLLEELMP